MYTLCTCHEIAKVNPSIMCFHLLPTIDHVHMCNSKMMFLSKKIQKCTQNQCYLQNKYHKQQFLTIVCIWNSKHHMYMYVQGRMYK